MRTMGLSKQFCLALQGRHAIIFCNPLLGGRGGGGLLCKNKLATHAVTHVYQCDKYISIRELVDSM